MDQAWSWILTAVGLAGFILAGKKVWWCWYVNIACQALWFAYAIATEQWGFFVSAAAYTFVFTKNAISWTKEHKEQNSPSREPKEARDVFLNNLQSSEGRMINLDDVAAYVWDNGVYAHRIDPEEMTIILIPKDVREAQERRKPEKPPGDDPRAGHEIRRQI